MSERVERTRKEQRGFSAFPVGCSAGIRFYRSLPSFSFTMANANTQGRFTEQDANELFAFIPGNPDDPELWKEFLATFKQVPGFPAPPSGADLKLPFFIQCNVSTSLPKSDNDASVQKVVANAEASLPMGSLLKFASDPVFARKVANEAFTAFRDTGMTPISEKLKCVCCGRPHTQSTKSVASAILGIPNANNNSGTVEGVVPQGFTMLVDPFYYVCSRPKCMATVLKAKEDPSNQAYLRLCYNCGKYEDPRDRMRACSRCKIAYYCDPSCQKTHWPQHKKMCKTMAKK